MAQTPEHAARVLGLIGEPTLKEVKRVRRELALKYHPDRCAQSEQASRHMARINSAADTLTAYLKSKTHTEPQKPKAQTRAPQEEPRAPRTGRTSTKDSRPEPKQTRRSHSRAVQTEARSEQERCDWKTEQVLAQRASSSYRNILSRIGKPVLQPRVDLHILRFEAHGA